MEQAQPLILNPVMARCLVRTLCMTVVLLGTAVQGGTQEQDAFRLSVADAVRLALERNLDLTIERYEPLVAREQIRRTEGEFDPLLKLSAMGSRQEVPVNSALEQQAEGGIIVEESITPETALTGKLTPGTQYSLSLTAPAVETTNPNRLFDEYYRPVLNFGLVQPLLRDFGTEVNLVRFHQAGKGERIASFGVEAKMLTVIRDVETAYWNLFLAQQHLKAAEGSLELARDLVERLRRMLAAGRATALDLWQGETAVEARRSDVLRAQADLLNAQVRLQLLMNPNAGLRAPVLAREAPPEEGPPMDLERKIAQAFAKRPELRQQELVIENLGLEEVLARKNTLPRLDLIGNLGYIGLAGKGIGPNVRIVPPFGDTYGEAFDDFFTPDGNITWSIGLRFEMPLGNRDALGRLEQTRLRQQQERARLVLLRNQISVEVQTAFQDMSAGWARLGAADEEVKLARGQLEAAERQLSAGLTTVRKVLEEQDRVARAQDQRTQTLANYSAARSRLAAAGVESFDTYRLVIQQ